VAEHEYLDALPRLPCLLESQPGASAAETSPLLCPAAELLTSVSPRHCSCIHEEQEVPFELLPRVRTLPMLTGCRLLDTGELHTVLCLRSSDDTVSWLDEQWPRLGLACSLRRSVPS
jgi:hypothetical protein